MLRTQTITAHPSCLILSSTILTDSGNTYTRYNSNVKQHKKCNISKLSVQSQRKVKKAISYMAHMSPNRKIYNPKNCAKFNFKLAFITLTLSSRQQHTDQHIKKACLHPFLDYIQKVYKVKNYVWKSERQKNGNIHFHLVIDKFIGYEVIRERWNYYQENFSYLREYYEQFKGVKEIPDTKKEYYSVNSTDVHSVRKINDLHKYLIKYMIKPTTYNKIRVKRNSTHLPPKNYELYKYLSANTKSALKNMSSNGRIWGCSHTLSNITGARDFLCRDIEEEVHRLKESGKCYIKDESYFLYLGFDYKLLSELRCTHLLVFLHEYLFTEFGYSSQSCF